MTPDRWKQKLLQIRKGIPNTATADTKESVPTQVHGVLIGAESVELVNKNGLKVLYIISGLTGQLQESRLQLPENAIMTVINYITITAINLIIITPKKADGLHPSPTLNTVIVKDGRFTPTITTDGMIGAVIRKTKSARRPTGKYARRLITATEESNR